MILLLLSLAWITGIALGPLFGLPLWALCFAAIPLIFVPFFPALRKNLLTAFPVLLLLLGGVIISASIEKPADQSRLEYYNGRSDISMEGIIADNPVVRDRSTTFQFEVSSIVTNTGRREISGTALVKALPHTVYRYGDVLRIKGTIDAPQNSNRFDYVNYLAARDIYSEINFPGITILQRGKGSGFLSRIYDVRDSLAQSINRSLPEPQSSLAQAMFLGITKDIPRDLRDSFTRTGTNHILAISGMNLTIVMGMLLAMGIWVFGRRYSIYVWLSLLIIWLYSLLTGMEPPIVRSAVMGSMFLIAELLGRQKNAMTAITFAAAVMLGLNPRLLGDVSFQLSFLSLCGLILIYPGIMKLPWLEKKEVADGNALLTISQYLIEGLIVIISVIIATWPVIVYNFGISAALALPATIFILPVLPAIILVTFAISILGLFAPLLSQITGWLDWLLLSYFILIVQVFSALPFSSASIIDWQLWQTATYYIVLVLLLAAARDINATLNMFRKTASIALSWLSETADFALTLPLKWIALVLLIVNALAWAAIFNIPDDRLHVSVLDVGQGDAILIQTPERQKILIDGGPGPNSLELALGRKLPFWDRRIDLVIFTQLQADHITGLIQLVNSYEIGKAACAPTVSDSAAYELLVESIKSKDIPFTELHSLQAFSNGKGIDLEVLYPHRDAPACKADDPDCNDLVLRLKYGSISFLFAADIDESTERRLIIERAGLGSTVLKVGHHGSNTSSSNQFLAVVNPSAAVISVAKDNSYGHPSPSVLAHLKEQMGNGGLFLTCERGTVEFISDGSKLWVDTEMD